MVDEKALVGITPSWGSLSPLTLTVKPMGLMWEGAWFSPGAQKVSIHPGSLQYFCYHGWVMSGDGWVQYLTLPSASPQDLLQKDLWESIIPALWFPKAPLLRPYGRAPIGVIHGWLPWVLFKMSLNCGEKEPQGWRNPRIVREHNEIKQG